MKATAGETPGRRCPAGSEKPRFSPLLWFLLGALVLWVDHATGPFLQFRILQLVPVALASWYGGRGWGLLLASLLPVGDAWLSTFWEVPWTLFWVFANSGVRVIVLSIFAFLVDRAAEREVLLREVKTLKGLLPICSFCKKIRTEKGEWESIESYIAERSEADFTHGVCPPCAEQHYGKYFKGGRAPAV